MPDKKWRIAHVQSSNPPLARGEAVDGVDLLAELERFEAEHGHAPTMDERIEIDNGLRRRRGRGGEDAALRRHLAGRGVKL
jgi:hypothetical protein